MAANNMTAGTSGCDARFMTTNNKAPKIRPGIHFSTRPGASNSGRPANVMGWPTITRKAPTASSQPEPARKPPMTG